MLRGRFDSRNPASVLCFQPNPDTTQGEAEGTARLAKKYGFHSIVLVTTPDQTWRAELRFRPFFEYTRQRMDWRYETTLLPGT